MQLFTHVVGGMVLAELSLHMVLLGKVSVNMTPWSVTLEH